MHANQKREAIMIDFLQKHISSELTPENKMNMLREALQLLVLKILQDKGHFSYMAFVGGTALRILYGMRRFSEDLDFSVIDKKGYNFNEVISDIKRELGLFGLEVDTKTKTTRAVHSCMLKFSGLLKKLSLSALSGEKLSIKFDADSNPPSGGKDETTLVNNIYLISVRHLDLSSLYATKIHACCFRGYAKGRDFYDLVWYLGKKITPNYILLNNAIKQTQGKDPGLSSENISEFLLSKITDIDFTTIRKDAERFLEDKNELRLMDSSFIVKSIIDVFGKKNS
jgi:predicted nucleotidyltransferase component of viral defense system